MQPETVINLLQFGAMGLLAFMIVVGKQVLDAHMATLKVLIEGNQRLMEKLIDALLKLPQAQYQSKGNGLIAGETGLPVSPSVHAAINP